MDRIDSRFRRPARVARFATRLTVALLVLASAAPSARAAIPWRAETYSTRAENIPAGQLLRTFAAHQNIPLQITDQPTAAVSGDFQNMPARAFLDAVCEAAELVWFWDGVRLHVDVVSAAQMRMLTVEAITPAQASAVFQSLGFEFGPAAKITAVHGVGTLLTLSGGPRFLEVGEPVLRALDVQEKERRAQADAQTARHEEDARARDAQIQVRVFRLVHAPAADIVVRSGSAQSTVPGVARALQNIMQAHPAALSTGPQAFDRKRQIAGLRGSGLAAVGLDPSPRAEPADRPERREDAQADDSKAVIQADSRLNAIIVRDTAGRMPIYEALILQLDVPSPVIEISAAVVDLDASNDKALGIEFLSFGDGRSSTKVRGGFEADRTFNQGNGETNDRQPLFVDGPNLVRGSGFLSSVLVPVSGYELLARIRALEEKGEAQLVTSPSVTTLENVEAVLRQDETLFVRVAGREATDLFDVRAGVQLKVTPTIIREGEQVAFRLVVDVQDGSFSDLLVDGVPSARESAINTQAIVPADKTLLIGGYFVERQNNNTRQVPGLGNVPVAGRLFKRTENNRTRAQRFYFLTPRIVDVHREARLNRPPIIAANSPLPREFEDPGRANQRAHDLAGRAVPPTNTVPAEP